MPRIFDISISIVSHGQGNLVRSLLNDLRTVKELQYEIFLTLNIPEDDTFICEFDDLPIFVIRNNAPKGFGENHNAAFAFSSGVTFIVVNPDIRAPNIDLSFFNRLARQPEVGAFAPKVVNSNGNIEDSARYFPTTLKLLNRVFFRQHRLDYDLGANSTVAVDWVAGMFVAFPRHAFEAVGGFDIRYFMYMEDADICRRLNRIGFKVLVDTSTTVVHDAQRASRRSVKYLFWHLRSASRFLIGL